MSTPPVIILGMHRSGTTVLARLLESLGLFVGHSLEGNQESKFFLGLNQWILKQANASWDNPYCLGFMNDFLRERLATALQYAMQADDRQSFLGPDHTRRYADIRELDFPWGWKDPRNTFTVDIWDELFPEARIIHIYRNPVDVAASLKRREENRKKTIDSLIAREGINSLLNRGIQIQTSARVESLDEGVKLWFEYTGKAVSLQDRYGNRYLPVKYEELMAHPVGLLEKIAAFSGLDSRSVATCKALEQLDPGRVYAFQGDASLVSLYERIRNEPLLRMLGYADIGT